MTGELLGKSKAHISYCLLVADALELKNKEVSDAVNFTEALKVLIKQKEDELNAALARSSIPTAGKTQDIMGLLAGKSGSDIFSTLDTGAIQSPPGTSVRPGPSVSLAARPTAPELPKDVSTPEVVIPLSSMMHKGDSIAFMRSLAPDSFDHIITDAPYAIDMDMIQQDGGGMNIDSTRQEHDVQENKGLLRDYLREAKRSVRDKGFVITWCDISQWGYLLSLADEFGLTAQRWPLLWHKTHQCQNMAATYNFTKNFEIALVLRKGNATLTPQSSSIWQGSFGLNEKESFGHPFAKPVKLWQWLYAAVAQRGQCILDPFAGSGSSTVAAITAGYRPISVELNDSHYNRAVVNVTNSYRSLHPKVTFT
jgi:site-specific DNA-methyltransferase (adenine-specific)